MNMLLLDHKYAFKLNSIMVLKLINLKMVLEVSKERNKIELKGKSNPL